MRREAKAAASGTAVPAYGDACSSVLPTRFRFAVLGVAFLIGLVLAPSALATKKYLPVASFPHNEYEEAGWTPQYFSSLFAEAVAVSDKNGHIYVADSGRGAIYDYESATDKTPTRWNGTNTPAGSFGGSFLSVAVDNTSGDVYVADRTHRVIDEFDENGNLIESFGDTGSTIGEHNGQLAGLKTPGEEFRPSTASYTSFPIAVNQANHDLYVVDEGHKVIDIFDENGAYLKQITATATGMYRGATTGLAVNGANGNVYMADQESQNLLFEFNAAGNYVSTWDGSNTPSGYFSPPVGYFCCLLSVATEESSGHVLVGALANRAVDTFDENGAFLPPELNQSDFPGEYRLGYVSGVAIDQATGYLYVSGPSSRVEIYKPVIVPTVAINPASEMTTTSAKLSGHVDPATGEGGGPITECRFEYLTVYQYAENRESWNGATRAPCSPTPSSSPTDVSATVTGLTPGVEYRYRVVAANAEGENSAVAPAFSTVGHYRFSTQFGSAGSGDGQLNEPMDVAVNDETGDIYVADTGNHRVDQFSASGSFIRAFGADVGGTGVNVCTSGCQAGTPGTEPGQLSEPKFIRVDNSTGASTGDVYVADGTDRIVQKFDSSGNLIESWGSGGAIEFSLREGTIGGIAVDELGNLYVLTDNEPYNWTAISQDGMSRKPYPTSGEWYEGERLQLGRPGGSGIEIGPEENWYETQGAQNGGEGVRYSGPRAQIYQTEGLYKPVYGIHLTNSGLTIDHATNDLFVSQGTHIDRFAGAVCIPPRGGCEPSDSFGSGELEAAAGLANQPSNGLLYAADKGKDDVAVFAPMPLPDVTTGPAKNVETTSATITGHVDPGGSPGTISDCHFEYLNGPERNEVQLLEFSKDTVEGTFTLTFEGQTTKPIEYSRAYYARYIIQSRLEELSTIGAGNVQVGEVSRGPFEIEFIGRFADLNVPQLTADASGLIPSGATVTPETRFDGNGWAYAVKVPCSPAAPLSSATDVSATLTNLTPFSTYHYRLIATRSDGEGLAAYGGERSFTPAPANPPVVDGTSVMSVTPTSAVVRARINPDFSPTVYRFQYGTDTNYGLQTPSSESIGEDNADHSVSSEITDLTPGTVYHFRVLAMNINGPVAGPDYTFATPDRPTVANVTATGITTSSATLNAEITPGFRATTYHFEYGRTTAYGNRTVESASIGSDDTVHAASAAVSGLAPGATYHYRVVASNEIGTSGSPDQTFTTPMPPEERGKEELPKCKRGFIRRHGECVRKHRRHHHKRHHKRSHRHG